MSSKIRGGLIGYGYWGPNYARALTELPEMSLGFVCDTQEGQLRRAAARFPQILLSQDALRSGTRNPGAAVK